MNNAEKEEKRKRSFIIGGALLVLGLLAVLLDLSGKPKSRLLQKGERLEIRQGQEAQDPKEAAYEKLQKLFNEDEANFTKVVNGFERIGVLSDDSPMTLYMSKECKGSPELRYIGPSGDKCGGESCDKEMFNRLKQDKELCEVLLDTGKVYEVHELNYNPKAHELRFYINAEKTPYITDNNGLGTAFIYSNEKGLTSKGYRSIKKNWYMWILPKEEK